MITFLYFETSQEIKRKSKSYLALIAPLTPLITPLLTNIFPNELVSNEPNNMPKHLPIYYFASFIIVLRVPCFNKPDSLRDVTIFMIFSISYFEIDYSETKNFL